MSRATIAFANLADDIVSGIAEGRFDDIVGTPGWNAPQTSVRNATAQLVGLRAGEAVWGNILEILRQLANREIPQPEFAQETIELLGRAHATMHLQAELELGSDDDPDD